MSEAVKASIGNYLKARTKRAFKVDDWAFPQQLKFIRDETRLKALFCTRRAAKSYTGGLYMVEEALKLPGCNILYIGLTRLSAKGIVWKDILKEIDRKHGLNCTFNETELTMTFPNGSVIWLAGCDTDEEEMNKLLGKKYRLVVLDEASMFTVNMHQLVYGVLKPATADQRGTICLLGTSSNITRGLFYDITTAREPGWSLHTWTAHDNPFIKAQWEEELHDIRTNRPLFIQTALFRQWYLNEWVVDEDAKVYKYDSKRNSAAQLPLYDTPYSYVLGIDLGHSPDPSAFVVSAYHQQANVLYYVHAEKHLRFDVTDVANKIKELDARYNFDVKVIDGSNKMAVEELNIRHKVNVIAADKTGKIDFINLMNAEFIQERIKLLPGAAEYGTELETLVWVTENGKIKETPQTPRKEHPSLPNHLTDAGLYNWRYTFTYLHSIPEVKPLWGSQEHWEPMHIKQLEEQVKQKENPNHLDVTFDDNLFNFDLDDQL